MNLTITDTANVVEIALLLLSGFGLIVTIRTTREAYIELIELYQQQEISPVILVGKGHLRDCAMRMLDQAIIFAIAAVLLTLPPVIPKQEVPLALALLEVGMFMQSAIVLYLTVRSRQDKLRIISQSRELFNGDDDHTHNVIT